MPRKNNGRTGVDAAEARAAPGRVTAPWRPTARSRITNGKQLLAGDVDQRTEWHRRFRDLLSLFLSDLGGEANVSEAEKALVRRAAALEVELEQLESKFARGDASPKLLDLFGRLSGQQRRLLESLGLRRRAKDITPDPLDYARAMAEEAALCISSKP